MPSLSLTNVVQVRATTVSTDELPQGAVVVKASVFSADPYLVCRSSTILASFHDFIFVQRFNIRSTNPAGVAVGGAMAGFIAGKIVQSNNAAWYGDDVIDMHTTHDASIHTFVSVYLQDTHGRAVGDLIGANLPFSTVQVVTEDKLKATAAWKLTGLITEEQISLGIGILGMPGASWQLCAHASSHVAAGSTAYGGLIDVLAVKPGQTIFVSGVAGGAMYCVYVCTCSNNTDSCRRLCCPACQERVRLHCMSHDTLMHMCRC